MTALAAATPVKPKMPAMMDMIKNTRAQYSMIYLLYLMYVYYYINDNQIHQINRIDFAQLNRLMVDWLKYVIIRRFTMKYVIAWLLGVPLGLLILIYLISHIF